MPTARPVRAALVLSALAVTAAGCAAKPFPDLHPLTGAVTRDGRPVTAGGLIFLPEPGDRSGLIVNANVRADGTFTAETSRTTKGGKTEIKPDAPAGRYKVVYHPPSNGSRSGLEVELAERVTVGPGANPVTITLPLQLPRGSGEPRDDDPTAAPPEEK